MSKRLKIIGGSAVCLGAAVIILSVWGASTPIRSNSQLSPHELAQQIKASLDKDPADLMTAYKKTIAIPPNDAEAYCKMGLGYASFGQYDNAIAAFKKAIAINPDCAETYRNMGLGYVLLERYPEAIAAYRRSLRLCPKGRFAAHTRRAIGKLQGK